MALQRSESGTVFPSTFGRRWQGLIQVADPKVWLASTIPMGVATALAYREAGTVHLGWLLVALAGVYALEVSKNALNDWADYRSGVDRYVALECRTPYSGGKRSIVDGKLTEAEALAIGWATGAIGVLLGLGIVIWRAPSIIWVGLAGVFLATAYSVPPFQLSYRGWGEFAVGLAFGPLLTTGAYLVQATAGTGRAALIGLPLGFLIANVLVINEFPDFAADRKGGKRNWVVRLGRRRSVLLHGALYVGAYASLALLAWRFGEAKWLLGLVSLPFALKGISIARHHHDDIQSLLPANANALKAYLATGAALTAAALL